MKTIYKIGTRGSLLAKAQCELVKWQLEEKTNLKFELEIIKTRGDTQTSQPLWQMEGNDFFTKELDEALLQGQVDLVVHSYKDLGHQRPQGIVLAAVPPRSYAHDILLIKNSTTAQLPMLDKLVVGTSSPRRIHNIEKYLRPFLPVPHNPKFQVQTSMLRGNVNSRISKLQEGQYDAIVLALAGLERLALHAGTRTELQNLLLNLDFMVLPLSDFPAAAAQGALAIECRAGDEELRQKLQLLHHLDTMEEVSRERQAFGKYGGGCHLAVGIHVRKRGEYFMQFHRGMAQQEEVHIEEITATDTALTRPYPVAAQAFVGMPAQKLQGQTQWDLPCFMFDEFVQKVTFPVEDQQREEAKFFVTSPYCLPIFKKIFRGGSVWSSGSKTFKMLALSGYWVNGSADSLGHRELKFLAESKALALFGTMNANLPWKVLSSDQAHSELGETVGCYTRRISTELFNEEFRQKFSQMRLFFWTSFYQFQAYAQYFPFLQDPVWQEQLQHCCGMGKTQEELQKIGLKVLPFLSLQHFTNWFIEFHKVHTRQ